MREESNRSDSYGQMCHKLPNTANTEITQTKKHTNTQNERKRKKKPRDKQNAAITEMICRSKNIQTRETHVEEKCCQYGKTHKTQEKILQIHSTEQQCARPQGGTGPVGPAGSV